MSDDKASAHEIKADTKNIYTDDAIDPIYQAKGHFERCFEGDRNGQIPGV